MPRPVPPPAPPQVHAAQAPQAPLQAQAQAPAAALPVQPQVKTGPQPAAVPPRAVPGVSVPGGSIPGAGAAPAIGPATAAGAAAKAPPAPAKAQPAAPAAAPPPGAQRVRPPVRQALIRLRHRLVLYSFVLCVLIPPLFAAAYLWGFAADQYNSKVGFSVRLEETNSPLSILGGLTGISGSSSSDTDILFEFIQSQRLVADMDEQLNLHRIWSKPSGDPIFALRPDASLEQLVDYWNDMVHLSRGKSPGLLEVEVRAFDPQDAQDIATTLFTRSTDMINQLSAIAREDAIRYAREDLDTAQERLKAARAAVTRFRNLNQIVNPEQDIQSQAGLLANLRNQQAAALIEIDLLRETAKPGDPRLTQIERRLQVIENRIAAERDKFGLGADGDDNTAYANLVGEYERLVADREFAERAYVTALASYDGALAESRRKSRYLAAYMQPTIAETPVYPRRLTLLTMLSLFLFLSWSIAVLIYYSVKDRR
jgi:capsular polysaccharide transport system permease protein